MVGTKPTDFPAQAGERRHSHHDASEAITPFMPAPPPGPETPRLARPARNGRWPCKPRLEAGVQPEQVGEHEHLPVRPWSRADSNRGNRALSTDAPGERLRHAFEHVGKRAQLLEPARFASQPLRIRGFTPLQPVSTQLMHRLGHEAEMPHHGNTAPDEMLDHVFVARHPFHLHRVGPGLHQRPRGIRRSRPAAAD
jgi:hypothetical protein